MAVAIRAEVARIEEHSPRAVGIVVRRRPVEAVGADVEDGSPIPEARGTPAPASGREHRG